MPLDELFSRDEQPSLPQQPDTLLAAVAQQVPDHAADAIQAMLAQAHGHGFELFA